MDDPAERWLLARVGYRKSCHLDQAAIRECSGSMPLRRQLQTTSPIGFRAVHCPAVPTARGSDAAAPGAQPKLRNDAAPGPRRRFSAEGAPAVWDVGCSRFGRYGPLVRLLVWRRHPAGDLGAGVDAKLVQDAADVALHGALGYEQAGPDLLVAQAFSDQLRDLLLPVAQQPLRVEVAHLPAETGALRGCGPDRVEVAY